MPWKLGFIGCGNMGGALVRGVSRCTAYDIYLNDIDAERASALAKELPEQVRAADIEELYDANFLFLGVKPHAVLELLSKIAPHLSPKTVVISMAAGVSIKSLKEAAPANNIIRIMPNLPVALGKGMTLVATDGFKNLRLTVFYEMMSFTGSFDVVEEELIDAGTAISGCGPAFAYMFIDALAKGGAAVGVPADKALQYAARTVLGAAHMLAEGGKSPEELVEAVCSPRGSTIEGVNVLKAGELSSLTEKAVRASYERTRELGK